MEHVNTARLKQENANVMIIIMALVARRTVQVRYVTKQPTYSMRSVTPTQAHVSAKILSLVTGQARLALNVKMGTGGPCVRILANAQDMEHA